MQEIGNASALQFVQSMEIDSRGWMWIIDVGRLNILASNASLIVSSASREEERGERGKRRGEKKQRKRKSEGGGEKKRRGRGEGKDEGSEIMTQIRAQKEGRRV